ncbi:MAG: S1 RNA-binding domain-containing protein [Patescibacteria group bacterium]
MANLKDSIDELMEEKKKNNLKQLLTDPRFMKIPKKGDLIRGVVLSVSNSLVRIDFDGLKTGVVRGEELFEAPEYLNLKAGDEVEATIREMENENGEMELSFREAGHRKAWDTITGDLKVGKEVDVKILAANRGGLMISLNSLPGFLPVSQLSPEHYPRVIGGDKGKILEKLQSYINQMFHVKVIDADEKSEKLIVSERAVWDDAKKSLLTSYKVGDVADGVISALTNFGAFVKFDEVEGLIHISEIAWQRIDHPKDILKVGDKVKAQIIQIDGAKIFLSIKRLMDDPWKQVGDKYKVGQQVKGKVLKVNPFGLFVELDPDIHGLAHVSSLGDMANKDVGATVKEGDTLDFEIISIEPNDHRLGLKLASEKK